MEQIALVVLMFVIITTIYESKFIAIGNAFAVLNDAEKRRRYDQFGNEAERVSSHRYQDNFDYTRGGFEGMHHIHAHCYSVCHIYIGLLKQILRFVLIGDISAEELFNMFFGGGFANGMNQ